MIGVRNLYRVFQESRKAAQEHATLAVLGTSERATKLANILSAQRGVQGAEIILSVPDDGGALTLSGKAVDDPDEVNLSAVSEGIVCSELVPRIVAAMDEKYLISLGRGYPLFRRAVCEEVIQKNARQNAVIGALPIPGADMPVMTANQGRMVLNIAAIHGEALSIDRAQELVGVVAAGFGLRALTRQLVKFIPLGGWAAAAAIGYAGTVAMGRATMLYFERGKQEVGEGEMSDIRRRAVAEAENFVARFRNR
ncbi:MAG: DUF697 domain-containing protein [Rubrobacteraceae bacterium]